MTAGLLLAVGRVIAGSVTVLLEQHFGSVGFVLVPGVPAGARLAA